jgi:hypothetical protein
MPEVAKLSAIETIEEVAIFAGSLTSYALRSSYGALL